MGLLAVFFPLAVASHFFFPGTWTFVLCAIALVPLARLMGEATEVIAHKLGSGLGGLMNASFGNAAELIIALAALRSGHGDVVKASITGAILGNLLLVLGAAILAGGLKYPRQTFNMTAALSGSAIMFLALTAMTIPDLFHAVRGPAAEPVLFPMSVAISVILLIVYALSLLFSLKTHAHLYAGEEHGTPEEMPGWSTKKAAIVLLAATLGVVVVAEFLVHAIEPAIATFGFTHTFVGVIIIAIIGNAAEHSTAILMALKNKMDLAFNIAFESSKQIALFVAPVLVLVSIPLGQHLTLEFSHMEVAGIAIGTGAAALIALDGESNWLEGVMLLGVYAILGVAFFFIP
ncbi:calcium/proton exchanger [Corallococcus praedator]|uniref:Ca(2+)/H(+) antiporter n=1 Tax=Corallococcus praedator TaxID=2316724 RepID=A0ABX9Q955_9BACT|nr:calcium/proton exchanger [Corallococcus sp. CA047B]RKH20524.1 calcium/proton exchanger [Corallococcus sp. CA031C]RKH92815.1 calcium/proton exchanger [Corallococcus praedator]